jgi:hypothetical protein
MDFRWTMNKFFDINMSHAVFGTYHTKNYSLFLWDPNLTGLPVFLFAKSGNAMHTWMDEYEHMQTKNGNI